MPTSALLEQFRGHWALVTGASSGIGAEFCRQLAAAGLHLVLVARRRERLVELADELRDRFGVQTHVIALDLSEPDAAQRLHQATQQLELRIRLLVNNAAYGPWGSFEKTSAQTYERLIQLVAMLPISLCRRYLPDLSSFPTSAIINLSSPAALQPVPYKAAYSAAKACLHNFSLALHAEWAKHGIAVQTLLPGPTASELDALGGAYPSLLTEERRPPAEVVAASLGALQQGRPFVTTNRGTYKQRVFAGLAPIRFVIREVNRMFQAPPGR